MWKYVDCKGADGKPATGDEGKALAKDTFNIFDPKCPIVETVVPGRFAVWCAAPLNDAKHYDELHHEPKNEADKGKYAYVQPG